MMEMVSTAIVALIIYLLGLAQGWTMTREEWRKSIRVFTEGIERDMDNLRAEVICLSRMNPKIPFDTLIDECKAQRIIRRAKKTEDAQ